MSFYLLSEGLTCVSLFSGVYESLKLLSRAEKGVDAAALASILEFWLVLAAAILVEEYLGMFLYWVPFFYLFKFLFFVLLLVPNTKFSHVIYSGFMEPAIDSLAQNSHTQVVPVIESLLLRHGRWFHQRLLTRSFELLADSDLLKLERELQDKIADVQAEIRERECRDKAEDKQNK